MFQMQSQSPLPDNLKAWFETNRNNSSVSYDVWRKKVNRLVEGNVRTTLRVKRELGWKPNDDKPFVGYDGEGWGNKYTLLANSRGERIENQQGLSTLECLEFLTRKYDDNPYRIWFSADYDVNHILRDLPDDLLLRLPIAKRGVKWGDYRIAYIHRKILSVNGIRYYDMFAFFNSSFIKAIKMFLDLDDELINEGKAARSDLSAWDFQNVIEYNNREVEYLAEIGNRFRNTLRKINIHLSQWYGPGAIAKYWFKQYNVEKQVPPADQRVNSALEYAYYGGRFEQIVLGTVSPVYEYDIHSAYPSVIASLPYLREWRHASHYQSTPFSIWRISFDLRGNNPEQHIYGIQPLPIRSKDGHISFPLVGQGWYWQKEIEEVFHHYPWAKVKVHEGYIASVDGLPFEWVKQLYEERLKLKQKGDLSEYAIKVGLNSLYGKTAQRVGSNPYFNLGWAGYITSSTRAKLVHYAHSRNATILGFATDALFSNTRLPDLPISERLGEWEELPFTSGTFFESGIYRLRERSGEVLNRTRGLARADSLDEIETQLREHPYRHPRLHTPRFVTNALAIHAPNAYAKYRLQFLSMEYEMRLEAPFKRIYLFPPAKRKSSEGFIDFGAILEKPIRSWSKVTMNSTWDPMPFGEYMMELLDANPATTPFTYPQRLKNVVLQTLEETADAIADALGEVPLDGLPVMQDTMK